MKYLISLIMLLLIASNVGAQGGCYERFIEDGKYESRFFRFQDSELESDFEFEPLGFSKEAIVHVASGVGCDEEELGLRDKSALQANCKEIIAGEPDSNVCYIMSRIGSFIVSMDHLGNVNIIFNRIE